MIFPKLKKIQKKQILFYGFFFLLYLSSIFLLLFKISSYPHGLYNWENYTIWRIYQRQHGELLQPLNNYVQMTEGLMTDSGLSPFVGIPIEFVFHNSQENLYTLRLWNVFIGVVTLLFFFLITRQLFGLLTAVFSSFYLLFAPAFLVYMRTATNVGISLLFSLLTIYLLYLVWEKPRKIIYYIFLIFSLAINSYVYAPIRFLLLIAIALFIWRILSLGKRFINKYVRTIIFVFLLCLLVFFIVKNITIVGNYFHGRGEQIVTQYNESLELRKQGIQGLVPILIKNATDIGKLYINLDTRPAVIDFWNPHGQLISTFLVPFFLLGLFFAFRRIKQFQYSLLLIWFFVTSVPIIFTNNVHIGRLIFSLPPLFIFVGIGLTQLLQYVQRLFYTKILYPVLGGVIIISLFFEVSPYFSKHPVIDNYISSQLLKTQGIGNTDLYLFNADTESLRFWMAYFYLHNTYVFKDLNDPMRKFVSGHDSPFTIHFIEQGATQNDIEVYCNENPYPVILVGAANPDWLNLPCKNRILQY